MSYSAESTGNRPKAPGSRELLSTHLRERIQGEAYTPSYVRVNALLIAEAECWGFG